MIHFMIWQIVVNERIRQARYVRLEKVKSARLLPAAANRLK